ncbi:T9SS type A sorting domain-containing protein [Crocinitomix catalasitica]|uniref:T9SS type A sorting domain-containing protein n=1 Tax=Crocinitomix catalasitica TaxID=184607 RepID=UPI0004856B68|nr:T9SS type A sorting domain-containing protein [Crocinitomix catalasitica]
MKNLNLKLLFAFFIANAHFVSAQIIGRDAYLIGDYLNIAINGTRGNEGGQNSGVFHERGGDPLFPCGLVADIDRSDWDYTSFYGDYYSAGTPENGFGIRMNGIDYSNNYNVHEIDTTALINYSDEGNCINAFWQGEIDGLEVKVNYQLKKDALYYKTTVKMINNTDEDLVDLYYYRTVDPDNNQALTGDFRTTNTIVSQPDSACQKALVSATQDLPVQSYLGFGAIGENFRVSMGGFSNRDAEDIWNGESPRFESNESFVRVIMDEAISLAYKTDLLSGDSVNFSFIVAVSEDAMNDGLKDLFRINYSTDDDGLGLAWNECTEVDTVHVCPGVPVMLFIEGENTDVYNWHWSPPLGLTTEFGDTTFASPRELTRYTVSLEVDDCMPIVAKNIVYEPIGYNTTISRDRRIFIGETTTLEATGGDSYTWFPTDGLSDPLSAVTDATPTETTIYSVVIGFDEFDCDDTLSVTVFVDEVEDDLGISTNSKYENITIYPNPSNDFITVDFGQVLTNDHKIIMHNAMGQIVYSKEDVIGEKYSIKLEWLSPGTYILSLRNNENKAEYSTKLVVE